MFKPLLIISKCGTLFEILMHKIPLICSKRDESNDSWNYLRSNSSIESMPLVYAYREVKEEHQKAMFLGHD